MEASSPKSFAAKTIPARPSPAGVPFGKNAPSVALPLAFILVGLSALVATVVWMALRPSVVALYHYNQYVVAATHLLVLGWIGSVVMGATYQLVPVALETKLYSERLAVAQLVFHVVGFVGMVWMFYHWNLTQVGHFGCVLAVGVGLFVYNLARTLMRVSRWNVTAGAVTAALGWISLAVTAGLCIAAGKSSFESEDGPAAQAVGAVASAALRPLANFMHRFDPIGAMHAHAHLGGVGLFTMLIVGVSYKLVPMFTLSEIQSRPRAALSVLLLNLGLVGSFLTILLRSPWKLGFALVVVAALAVYGWEVQAILRARKRRSLDWGLRYFLTAIGLYFPVSILAVVLSWPTLSLNTFTGQLENVYGLLALLGVVSFAIIGMLYKIVPFLVWFGRYSRHVGRAQVPALADLYSARLQAIGYWTYLLGLLVLSVAALFSHENGVRCGGALLLLSIFTLVLNVARMLSHYLSPGLKPLTLQTSTVLKPT